MAEKNTADIGFEKKIWDAACILRGNLDASEYKSVVLGLIFLKYISDRFEEKYTELLSEGDGFEEDIDEYTSENIFFVPQDARWAVIAESAHTAEIGTIIDAAMRSIEKAKGNCVSTALYINQAKYNDLKTKFGVPAENEILITAVGTLGVPYLIGHETLYFKDGNLIWLRTIKGALPKYNYLWLPNCNIKLNYPRVRRTLSVWYTDQPLRQRWQSTANQAA